jgi:hypothetical protein
MMADPSDQPLEFDSRKAPDMAVHQTINISSTVPAAMSEHGTAATSTQSWGPSASLGFYPQAPVPPQAPQVYISVVYYSVIISNHRYSGAYVLFRYRWILLCILGHSLEHSLVQTMFHLQYLVLVV